MAHDLPDVKDKHESAERRLLEMKRNKKRGRVVFYLDGSGRVNNYDVEEKY